METRYIGLDVSTDLTWERNRKLMLRMIILGMYTIASICVNMSERLLADSTKTPE